MVASGLDFPCLMKVITASSKHCNKDSEQLWAVHVWISSWSDYEPQHHDLNQGNYGYMAASENLKPVYNLKCLKLFLISRVTVSAMLLYRGSWIPSTTFHSIVRLLRRLLARQTKHRREAGSFPSLVSSWKISTLCTRVWPTGMYSRILAYVL